MKRILNCGCGLDTYGTDFIDVYPSRKGVIKCNFDMEKFPFEGNYFDEVYAENIFEHLKNPLNFLKESRRVLKSGGKITLLTDNAGFWGVFGSTHHGSYEKIRIQKGTPEDRHYALFTPSHLNNWLKSVGFKNIKIKYFVNNKQVKESHIILFRFLMAISERFAPHLEATAEK